MRSHLPFSNFNFEYSYWTSVHMNLVIHMLVPFHIPNQRGKNQKEEQVCIDFPIEFDGNDMHMIDILLVCARSSESSMQEKTHSYLLHIILNMWYSEQGEWRMKVKKKLLSFWYNNSYNPTHSYAFLFCIAIVIYHDLSIRYSLNIRIWNELEIQR